MPLIQYGTTTNNRTSGVYIYIPTKWKCDQSVKWAIKANVDLIVGVHNYISETTLRTPPLPIYSGNMSIYYFRNDNFNIYIYIYRNTKRVYKYLQTEKFSRPQKCAPQTFIFT